MFIQNYSCKTSHLSLLILTVNWQKNHYISSQKYNLFFLPFCSKLEHYLPLKAGDRTRHICHPPSGHRAVCCLYGQYSPLPVCMDNIHPWQDTSHLPPTIRTPRCLSVLYGQIQRRGGSYKICSHNINLLADTPIPCQGLGSDMNSDRGAWQVDSG